MSQHMWGNQTKQEKNVSLLHWFFISMAFINRRNTATVFYHYFNKTESSALESLRFIRGALFSLRLSRGLLLLNDGEDKWPETKPPYFFQEETTSVFSGAFTLFSLPLWCFSLPVETHTGMCTQTTAHMAAHICWHYVYFWRCSKTPCSCSIPAV